MSDFYENITGQGTDAEFDKELAVEIAIGAVQDMTKQVRRFQRFQDIGCIACRKHGIVGQPADVHHLLSGGRRRGHEFTIPLCPYHHRGVGVGVGPSLAGDGSKPFHREYGSDEALLAATNLLLEGLL